MFNSTEELVTMWVVAAHLAGEYQAEEDGDGQLAMAEEDDVEEVGVGGVLEEEPERGEAPIKILIQAINKFGRD